MTVAAATPRVMPPRVHHAIFDVVFKLEPITTPYGPWTHVVVLVEKRKGDHVDAMRRARAELQDRLAREVMPGTPIPKTECLSVDYLGEAFPRPGARP